MSGFADVLFFTTLATAILYAARVLVGQFLSWREVDKRERRLKSLRPLSNSRRPR